MTDPIDIVDALREWSKSNSLAGYEIRKGADYIFLTRGLREAADEIERLRGESKWEYGYSLLNKDGEPTGLIIPANAREGAREGEAYVRRRKAGPWERVEGEGDGHDQG